VPVVSAAEPDPSTLWTLRVTGSAVTAAGISITAAAPAAAKQRVSKDDLLL
jgi:hypothetical protein